MSEKAEKRTFFVLRKLFPRYIPKNRDVRNLLTVSNPIIDGVTSNRKNDNVHDLKVMFSSTVIREFQRNIESYYAKSGGEESHNEDPPIVSFKLNRCIEGQNISNPEKQLDEIIISSTKADVMKQATNMVGMHVVTSIIRERIQYMLEVKNNWEITIDLKKFLGYVGGGRQFCGMLGCEIVDLSFVSGNEHCDTDTTSGDPCERGIWIKGMKPSLIMATIFEPSIFERGSLVFLAKLNGIEICSSHDLKIQWEKFVQKATLQMKRGELFQLNMTLDFYNVSSLNFIQRPDILLGYSARKKTPSNVRVKESSTWKKLSEPTRNNDSIRKIDEPCKNDRIPENFREKYLSIINVEFFGMNADVVLNIMWNKHKHIFGDKCADACICPTKIWILCENVIEKYDSMCSVEERNNLSIILEKRNKAGSGFVDSFCVRFMKEAVKTYPKLVPIAVVNKLISFWSIHKAEASLGPRCGKKCLCSNIQLNWFVQLLKKSEIAVNSVEVRKRVEKFDDNTLCLKKEDQILSVVKRGTAVPPDPGKILKNDSVKYSEKGDPCPSVGKIVSSTSALSHKFLLLPLQSCNDKNNSYSSKNGFAYQKKVSFLKQNRYQDSNNKQTRPRDCVSQIDHETLVSAPGIPSEEQEKLGDGFMYDFLHWKNSPKFSTKKQNENKKLQSHCWVESYEVNFSCRFCSKRKNKVVVCEVCHSCHNCGMKHSCSSKSFKRKEKPKLLNMTQLLASRYQSALNAALGVSTMETICFQTDESESIPLQTEKMIGDERKRSMFSAIQEFPHVRNRLVVPPTLLRALQLLSIESKLINVPVQKTPNDSGDKGSNDNVVGKTILFAAVMHSDYETVLHLLKMGADVSVKDYLRKRAHDYAKKRHDRISYKIRSAYHDKEDVLMSWKAELYVAERICKVLHIFLDCHRLYDMCQGVRDWFTVRVSVVKGRQFKLTLAGESHLSGNFLYFRTTWDNKVEAHEVKPTPFISNPIFDNVDSYYFRFNDRIKHTYQNKLLVIDIFKGQGNVNNGRQEHDIKLSSWVEEGGNLYKFADENGNSGEFSLAPSEYLSSGFITVSVKKMPYDLEYQKLKQEHYRRDLTNLINEIEVFDNGHLMPVLVRCLLHSAVHVGNLHLVQKMLSVGMEHLDESVILSALELCIDIEDKGKKDKASCPTDYEDIIKVLSRHRENQIDSCDDKPGEKKLDDFLQEVETETNEKAISSSSSERGDGNSVKHQKRKSKSPTASNPSKNRIDDHHQVQPKRHKFEAASSSRVVKSSETMDNHSKDVILPILRKPSWMLKHPKTGRCFSFDRGKCPYNACKFAHVHTPCAPPLLVLKNGALSLAYKRNFETELRPNDICILSEFASNGSQWHTAGFRCRVTSTVFYAAGGQSSHESPQRLFWYPTVNYAILALEGVVLADFFFHNLDLSDIVHMVDSRNINLANKKTTSRLGDDALKRKRVNEEEMKNGKITKTCVLADVQSVSLLNKPVLERKTDSLQKDAFFQTEANADVSRSSHSNNNKPSQMSYPTGSDKKITALELPMLDNIDWMLSPSQRTKCTSFMSQNNCKLGKLCKFAHVFQTKDVSFLKPPDPSELASEYKSIFRFELAHRDRCVLSRKIPSGEMWYTAGFCCPISSTVYYSKGVNGFLSAQDIYWYVSKDDAILALDAIVLHAIRQQHNGAGESRAHSKSKTCSQKVLEHEDDEKNAQRINRKDRVKDDTIGKNSQNMSPNHYNKNDPRMLVELPVLQNQWWMNHPPCRNICSNFNTVKGCKHGVECRFAHVYRAKGTLSPLVLGSQSLRSTYKKTFNVDLPINYHSTMSRSDAKGRTWFTSGFICKNDRVIYYAEKLGGKANSQNIYWYTKKEDAELAVDTVIWNRLCSEGVNIDDAPDTRTTAPISNEIATERLENDHRQELSKKNNNNNTSLKPHTTHLSVSKDEKKVSCDENVSELKTSPQKSVEQSRQGSSATNHSPKEDEKSKVKTAFDVCSHLGFAKFGKYNLFMNNHSDVDENKDKNQNVVNVPSTEPRKEVKEDREKGQPFEVKSTSKSAPAPSNTKSTSFYGGFSKFNNHHLFMSGHNNGSKESVEEEKHVANTNKNAWNDSEDKNGASKIETPEKHVDGPDRVGSDSNQPRHHRDVRDPGTFANDARSRTTTTPSGDATSSSRADALPRLDRPDWMAAPRPVCRAYGSASGCRNRGKCRFAHVYRGATRALAAPAPGELRWAYQHLFRTGTSRRDYGVLSRPDARNQTTWYTAGFCCPVEGTLYHAEGLGGVPSAQSVFWYRSEREATLAVDAVVLSDMRARGCNVPGASNSYW